MSAGAAGLDADPWGPTEKSWRRLCARAALAGRQLYRTDPDDGVQTFFLARHDDVVVFRSAEDIDSFLERLAIGQCAATTTTTR
jgi:hypothetical protein